MKTIGDKIRRERIRQGISQKKLSLGICSQSSLSRLENNDMSLSMRKVNQILERLGLSFMDLAADEGTVKGETFLKGLDKTRHHDDYDGMEAILRHHHGIKAPGEKSIMYMKWHHGLVALHKKDYGESEKQLRHAIYIAEKFKFRNHLPELYMTMGDIKHFLEEPPLKYYTGAYKIYRELNLTDFRLEIKILYHLIVCNSNEGQHHQVILKCKKAINILSRNFSSYMMCDIYDLWFKALAGLNEEEEYTRLRCRTHIIFEQHSCLDMWEKLENYPAVNN
ncbi:helix-turn-helix domain-containing protein [Salinicoccus halitifaciens]|uniref:Transcriptional regulator with XRE-family HTH domain n=1 Tax=Salinicoccus halitifaciens TaxID=1073415 RepID=A0ABV2E9E0_9STAP|nr:helix-turn-helix transcriptional regulator [Salinicoccus halitifaciens]MCD2137810.1 helix-turn-helix domain-containing protein [Salinicoccus halitifaciens]